MLFVIRGQPSAAFNCPTRRRAIPYPVYYSGGTFHAYNVPGHAHGDYAANGGPVCHVFGDPNNPTDGEPIDRAEF